MNRSCHALRTRLTLASVVLVGLLSAVGCNSLTPPPSYFVGTVTVDGVPVSGTIYFWYLGDGSTAPEMAIGVPLDAQGTFVIYLIPDTQYAISLTNPQAPLPGPVPDVYADPASSGLRVSFPASANAHTLDIRISSQNPTANQVIAM